MLCIKLRVNTYRFHLCLTRYHRSQPIKRDHIIEIPDHSCASTARLPSPLTHFIGHFVQTSLDAYQARRVFLPRWPVAMATLAPAFYPDNDTSLLVCFNCPDTHPDMQSKFSKQNTLGPYISPGGLLALGPSRPHQQ